MKLVLQWLYFLTKVVPWWRSDVKYLQAHIISKFCFKKSFVYH